MSKEKIMNKTFLILGVAVCIFVFNPLVFAGTWRDGFADNDTPEWKIHNPANGAAKWWTDKGEAVGEALAESIPTWWLTGEPTWQNYTISCQAKLVKIKKDFATFGLAAHFNIVDEATSFYYFRVISGLDFISIKRHHRLAPRIITLGEFDFGVEADKWYQLTATIHKNGIIEFQIEDEKFTVFDPNPLEQGQPALSVSNAQVRFDDVEIMGTNIRDSGPGDAQSVSPQSKLTTIWSQLKR